MNTDSKANKKNREKLNLQAQDFATAAVMGFAASHSYASAMFPDLDLESLIKDFDLKINAAHDGSMKEMEAMLVGQAQALQTIFASLANRSAKQEYTKNYTIFLNLALKAQSQSRATIEALNDLKNPRQVAFVKQTNIAGGHQQVNNAVDEKTRPSCAEKITNQPYELLSEVKNAALDSRRTTKTGRANPQMEAVGKQHWSHNR